MRKVLIAVFLMLPAYCFSAESQSGKNNFSCEKLVGEWRGSHTYDDGYKSDYIALKRHDGFFEIHFSSTDVNGEVKKVTAEALGGVMEKNFQPLLNKNLVLQLHSNTRSYITMVLKLNTKTFLIQRILGQSLKQEKLFCDHDNRQLPIQFLTVTLKIP